MLNLAVNIRHPMDHDGLLPLLFLPPTVLAIFLTCYFLVRLLKPKFRYRRRHRLAGACFGTLLICGICFAITDPFRLIMAIHPALLLTYLLLIVLVNVLFSIWYRR